MAHSAEWHERRRQGIGGSDCNIIMGGDPKKIMDLWRVKIGLDQPEDLSRVLPVRMGSATEELNIEFASYSIGEVGERSVRKSYHDWPVLTVEFDGMLLGARPMIPVECKHVNQMSKMDEVVLKYQPQLHALMLCAGTQYCYLSVFIGTLKHEIVKIEFDAFYADAMLTKLRGFWSHVESKTAPIVTVAVAAPVAPVVMRTIDLTAVLDPNAAEIAPNWARPLADDLEIWLKTLDAAKKNEDAVKEVKVLMPNDVGLITYFPPKPEGGVQPPQITVTRNKALAVSIKKG